MFVLYFLKVLLAGNLCFDIFNVPKDCLNIILMTNLSVKDDLVNNVYFRNLERMKRQMFYRNS